MTSMSAAVQEAIDDSKLLGEGYIHVQHIDGVLTFDRVDPSLVTVS